jgi:AbrB family looped-hinge helix DNA binding protein
MSSSAKVSSKGQVVIPQAIRERLGIREGDELEFVVAGEGWVHVRIVNRVPFQSLRGAWKEPGDPHLTDEDIRDAIAEGARRGR